MVWYQSAPKVIPHSKSRQKAEKHTKLDLINCQICYAPTKIHCSGVIHHAYQVGRDKAKNEGLPSHLVHATGKLAAKSKMREIGWNPTPQPSIEPPPHWSVAYEKDPNDPPSIKDCYENSLSRDCVINAPNVITAIRRAMHHTLVDNDHLGYLDLMKFWAKQIKRELPDVVTMIGQEITLWRKCEGCGK